MHGLCESSDSFGLLDISPRFRVEGETVGFKGSVSWQARLHERDSATL